MVDNDELKERLLILRDRLENASGVSPSDRDLWTSLMAEIIAISENKQLSNNSAQLGFRELWSKRVLPMRWIIRKSPIRCVKCWTCWLKWGFNNR